MNQPSKTILFFGNERLATGVSTTAPTLQALIHAGYTVAAVISNYEQAASRNARDLEIAEIAKKHNIPLHLPNRPLDIIDQLKTYRAQAAVLVAYGRIVPQSIIDIFPKGIINIHPSLLPLHRGPTPLESVLLSGAEQTGVSIMALSSKMDAGPVYAQTKVMLDGDETKQQLADQLLEIGGAMLIEVLPGILDGSIIAKPQNDELATYDQLLKKSDGLIDWHKPAVVLQREIRAYRNWPKSFTTLNTIELTILEATVVDLTGPVGTIHIKDNSLVIYCAEQALSVNTLQPAGKKVMPIEAFLTGYGSKLNNV